MQDWTIEDGTGTPRLVADEQVIVQPDEFGDRFQLVQTEYRFPLTRVLRGPGTVPLFFDRMWGLVFFDVGDAYFGPLVLSDFRKGAGAEIHMDFTIGYSEPMSLRLGFAYGFDEGGGAQFYVAFGRPF